MTDCSRDIEDEVSATKISTRSKLAKWMKGKAKFVPILKNKSKKLNWRLSDAQVAEIKERLLSNLGCFFLFAIQQIQ